MPEPTLVDQLAAKFSLNHPNAAPPPEVIAASVGKSWVVSVIGYEYNDEYYYSHDDAGDPVQVFVGPGAYEAAQAAVHKLDAKYLKNNVHRLDDYFNQYSDISDITSLDEDAFVDAFNALFGTACEDFADCVAYEFQKWTKAGMVKLSDEQAAQLEALCDHLTFHSIAEVPVFAEADA